MENVNILLCCGAGMSSGFLAQKTRKAAKKRAMDRGVEVIGYMPWSAIDLLSTSNGYRKRYGFIYVDRTDDDPKECARIRKDSFYWYQQVIASRGTDLAVDNFLEVSEQE